MAVEGNNVEIVILLLSNDMIDTNIINILWFKTIIKFNNK